MTNKNKQLARELESLARLMRGIGEIFDTRVEAHQVELFCVAAAAHLRGEPMDGRTLADALGLSTSAVSRNLAWFSERGRLQRAGLRMIEGKADPVDYRRR